MKRILVLFRRNAEDSPLAAQALVQCAEALALQFVVKDSTDPETEELISVVGIKETPAIALALEDAEYLFWQEDMLVFYGETLINTQFMIEQFKIRMDADPEDLTKA